MQSIYEGQKLKDKQPWMQLKSACTSEQIYMIKMCLFNKKRFLSNTSIYLTLRWVDGQRRLVLTDENAPSSIACCQSLILLL